MSDETESGNGPILRNDDDAPVLIFVPGTNEEAEVVRATLEAAGIRATFQSGTINPYFGALDTPMRDAAGMGIFVAPSQVEAARLLLSEEAPTEEELAAEEAADPKTLEEAEAEVRNAGL